MELNRTVGDALRNPTLDANITGSSLEWSPYFSQELISRARLQVNPAAG